jgi:hypothetical protein
MSTYEHAFGSDFFLEFSQPVVNAFKAFGVSYVEDE